MSRSHVELVCVDQRAQDTYTLCVVVSISWSNHSYSTSNSDKLCMLNPDEPQTSFQFPVWFCQIKNANTDDLQSKLKSDLNIPLSRCGVSLHRHLGSVPLKTCITFWHHFIIFCAKKHFYPPLVLLLSLLKWSQADLQVIVNQWVSSFFGDFWSLTVPPVICEQNPILAWRVLRTTFDAFFTCCPEAYHRFLVFISIVAFDQVHKTFQVLFQVLTLCVTTLGLLPSFFYDNFCLSFRRLRIFVVPLKVCVEFFFDGAFLNQGHFDLITASNPDVEAIFKFFFSSSVLADDSQQIRCLLCQLVFSFPTFL